MSATTATAADALEYRTALVEKLLADGTITSPAVERAFRTVSRHLFVPKDTTLEAAYKASDSVALKRDDDGVIISSTSAPFIQALMIEQAGLVEGMSVLEVGSGGYNAALLAEVVGPTGQVTSVDIDADVTERASALLAATGYGDRVRVSLIDAEHEVPDLGPVDAIIVTVGAWDLSPAWLAQLKPDGIIVVPLRMNGITRSIGFRREGDHLVSTSAHVCGFVAMQGDGAHDERIFLLPDPRGGYVRVRFDGPVPQDMSRLDGVLATDQGEVWSEVMIGRGVSFADLQLWLAVYLPGFCKFVADEGTEIRAGARWFPFGVVHNDSFAYLATRQVDDKFEFGARTYGAHGHDAGTILAEQIQAWDAECRRGTSPTFMYWPTDADLPSPGTGTAVLTKTHGEVRISWSE
jgi:protein-L-isoaspartate(D-aspartate) O-methyltransferase